MPDVVSLGLSGERNAMKWTSKAKEMRCPSVCPVSATLLPEARAVGGMRYPSVCPVSATEGATDGVEIEDAESLGLSGERNRLRDVAAGRTDAVSLGLSGERNSE